MIDNSTISGLADAIAKQALADHVCEPPAIRNMNDLGTSLIASLPEGFGIETLTVEDGCIVIKPKGFEVDDLGDFVATSLRFDPGAQVEAMVTLSTVSIPDVYLSGYDMASTVETCVDMDEVLGDLFYNVENDVHSFSIDQVEDVHVEIDVEVEVTLTLTVEDLLADPAMTFTDTDEYEAALREGACLWVSEHTGTPQRYVSVDGIKGIEESIA